MVRKKDSLALTYPGMVEQPGMAESCLLDELIRKFQSAKRYLRERIFEGYSRKRAVSLAKPLFPSNSRYMRDAFLEAEAFISSQMEGLSCGTSSSSGNSSLLVCSSETERLG